MKSKAQLNYEAMKEQEDKFIEFLLKHQVGIYFDFDIKELFKGIRQTEREKTKEEIIGFLKRIRMFEDSKDRNRIDRNRLLDEKIEELNSPQKNGGKTTDTLCQKTSSNVTSVTADNIQDITNNDNYIKGWVDGKKEIGKIKDKEFNAKVQKVQKELKNKFEKAELHYSWDINTEIDKIFAENCGLNEEEENKDG